MKLTHTQRLYDKYKYILINYIVCYTIVFYKTFYLKLNEIL